MFAYETSALQGLQPIWSRSVKLNFELAEDRNSRDLLTSLSHREYLRRICIYRKLIDLILFDINTKADRWTPLCGRF